MLSIYETAYPRFKSQVTEKELAGIYTPSAEELAFTETNARSPIARLGLLVLLKTFQRLGYFPPLAEVPRAIIQHMAETSRGFPFIPAELRKYETALIRRRHMARVRAFLQVTMYGPEARPVMTRAAVEAARTKDELADIINVAIEELVRQRFELPAFSTLLRVARTARTTVNRGYHHRVFQSLDPAQRARLEALLQRPAGEARSLWDRVKREPKSPTLRHMTEFIHHLHWLQEQNVGAATWAAIPDAKIKQFAAQARSRDVTSMNDLDERKRYTFAAALVREQVARALDDVAEMFLRRMQKIHGNGREALADYQTQHVERTDTRIARLKETVSAYKTEGTKEQRFDAMAAVLGADADQLLEYCNAHAAYAGHNYLPFLPSFYKSQRATLFRFIESVKLISTSQDRALEESIRFLIAHKKSKNEWLAVVRGENPFQASSKSVPLVDLSWIPDKWWPLVTGHPTREPAVTQVDRKYFELCLFSQILLERKSGDLAVEGSDQFSDYRDQLITWEEYGRGGALYGEQAGLAVEAKAFIEALRRQLETVAQATDESFPDNEYQRIEKGEPVLSRLARKPDPAGFPLLEKLIKQRLRPVNILDALVDTEHWLNWTQHFGPLSGYETKSDQPRERYVTTTFCYGCNLGPTQTSRSIKGLDRKQIAFVNQRHVTEEILDKTIVTVINGYNHFALPKLWGSGRHASADGTKWDLYEQNLLSEYHVRYGGYGGIGYYHVSDTYIALFSHFIPCGVWEAVHILDGLLKNLSDIQPDTLHADTQGQSAPVFGLAYLLGIKLMPRIRNWKNLKFYRPAKGRHYQHLDLLFSADVDWDLIQTLLPDMLRVALSIKAGRITSATLLRKLGTYSHKNKLYFAFRELGRVVRTIFLLQYLSEIDLRRLIQTATNKSEAFNKFIQWVAFGGHGTLAENVREEQRKVIKYNHLVSNLLIFHNVVSLTQIVRELVAKGHVVTKEALAALSPYQTEHINRFGTYRLNLERKPPAPEYSINLD